MHPADEKLANRCRMLFPAPKDGVVADKWDEPALRIGETVSNEKAALHLIAEVPCRRPELRRRSVSTLEMSGAITASR